jgi:hypothetical protein
MTIRVTSATGNAACAGPDGIAVINRRYRNSVLTGQFARRAAFYCVLPARLLRHLPGEVPDQR